MFPSIWVTHLAILHNCCLISISSFLCVIKLSFHKLCQETEQYDVWSMIIMQPELPWDFTEVFWQGRSCQGTDAHKLIIRQLLMYMLIMFWEKFGNKFFLVVL